MKRSLFSAKKIKCEVILYMGVSRQYRGRKKKNQKQNQRPNIWLRVFVLHLTKTCVCDLMVYDSIPGLRSSPVWNKTTYLQLLFSHFTRHEGKKRRSHYVLFLVTHKVTTVLHFSCLAQGLFCLWSIFRKNRCERPSCASLNSFYLT